MQAKNPGDIVGFQNAAFAQPFGTAGGFLGGLEQKQHVPGQLRQMGRRIFRQGQSHGGVAVVAAGMHDAWMDGGIRQAGALCHRESVHIRSESHGLGLPGVKIRTDAAGDGAGQDAAQGLQHGSDIAKRFGELGVQFRDAVQGAAVFDDGLKHRGDLPGKVYGTYYNTI